MSRANAVLIKGKGRSYDDTGTWNFELQRIESKKLTFGVAQQSDTVYYTFTPDESGRYWIGVESGYASGVVRELPEMDYVGSYGSNPCTEYLRAGVTYAISNRNSDLNGRIVAKGLPRSGSFGEAGTLTWELSEDGVLTIGGSGSCGYLYTPPWRYMEEEVRTLVIGKDVSIDEGLGSLPKLQTIRVEEGSEYLTVVDGVLYSADMTTLLYAPGSLRSFEIPEGVERVVSNAFAACRAAPIAKASSSMSK